MTGLWMLAGALALMVATGLPVYAVLLFLAALFGAGGVFAGVFDASLLGALAQRVVGLLENDLLQALPLYALIGALLNRLPLAAQMHRGGQWLLRRHGAAAELSALGVGALLAPMNGSVGASLHMLSRSVAPRMAASGMAAERGAATLCVASTLGVVIPPSLVLLLLGDAMMRAHTEAANVTHAAVRIVNNQDVMRAALVPGAIVLLLSLALVAWRGRGQARAQVQPLARRAGATVLVVVTVIAALLGAVALGYLYAVEAAASGGVLLLAWALLTRQLTLAQLRLVLRDAMSLSGMMFALLIAATAFTLVLRAYGTDALVAAGLKAFADRPTLLLALVMLGIAACSFVLDAFEIIFLVVPLVMPPVLQAAPDAAWVAVLTLLVLQLGFLLPPFGYAIVMSRSLSKPAPRLGALSRALAPQLLGQAALIAAVLAFPQITHWARPDEAVTASPAVSGEEAERLMRQMLDARDAEDAAASGARP